MSDLAGSLGLVTGASGFIGRAVMRALPREATVFATYSSDESFPAWAETCEASVHPVRVDLTATRLVEVCDEAFDWSVLLAARVVLSASREKPVDELVAVAGPAINTVAGLRARQIAHVSSGSVYETLTGRLSPELRLAPLLPYAVAKLAAEYLVISYGVAPVWTVRFFGAYGPGEPSFKVTRRMVDAFRRGESEFSLAGDGSNRIDPMHVDDAANSLLRLATIADSGVLDLCQGESKTMKEYAHYIYEAVHPDPFGTPLTLHVEGEAHEQMRGVADPSRADNLLGIERRSLHQGMQDYARYLASPE